MTILQAIQSLLTANSTIVAGLGKWVFDADAGEVPAIFVRDPAPEKCPNPCVTLREDGGQVADGPVCASEWVWSGTIMLWGNQDESDATLNALAWTIACVLDRAPIAPTGFVSTCLQCSAPSGLTDPDGFPGYRLTVAANFRSEV